MFQGNRIRQLREERGYSLSELSAKAGLSISYLSEIERGSKRPSLKTIEKLAAALSTSPKEFASGGKGGINLGERIRMLRQEKGLGMEEMADLSGLSYSYISEIERGLVLPSIKSLQNIAAALGITPDELMATGNMLGQKLTRVRREHGLNQAQLAREAGLSPGLIGQIEKGKVQPSLQTLEKISAVLNISPCYFVVNEDGLEELLRTLPPDIREILLDSKVQAVLRMLSQCSEKECRFILDMIGLLKKTNFADPSPNGIDH